MSATLSTVRQNIRSHLRDFGGRTNITEATQMDTAIASHVQLLAAKAGLGLEWVTSLITTVAGTRSYVLSGGIEYSRVILLRPQETGILLTRIAHDVIEQWRYAATSDSGAPLAYAALVNAPAAVGTQETTVLLGPTPSGVYLIDGLVSSVPLYVSTEAADIPFGELACRALEWQVAADLASVASAAVLAECGLDRGAVAVFRQNASEALYEATVQDALLTRSGHLRTTQRRRGR